MAAPLAIAVHAATFERLHYALVLASAAAAIGRPATLFFTGRAVHALADWRSLPAERGSALERDADYGARGLATFEVLLEACRELGVRLIVCELALKAEGLEPADLQPQLGAEVAGAVSFLRAGEAGQLLFV